MPDAPYLSVLIPTYQRREALGRALAALAEQTVPADEYEVVVAIDGSTDGTSELLAALDTPFALQTTMGPNRGRAAACNAALAMARGDVVVILDDDMEPAPVFVERHRRHHAPGSAICVIGAVPVRLGPTSPRAARYVQDKFSGHLARLSAPGHTYSPRDFYSGNASLRAELLREVGGFDESFAAYGNEDVDLWIRLNRSGTEFRFDPEALAVQDYDKDLRGLARDGVAKGGTAVMLARRHPEVFEQLRLAQPADGSRAWLSARSVLLWLTRRRPAVAEVAFAAAALAEGLGLWRRRLFYRAVLDYAFWAGVDAELRRGRDDGRLAELAARLRRGPLDLMRDPR